MHVPTLPESNIAPENGWFGWKTSFLLGWLPGRCYVSFREGNYVYEELRGSSCSLNISSFGRALFSLIAASPIMA